MTTAKSSNSFFRPTDAALGHIAGNAMNRTTIVLIAIILILCTVLGWWLFGPKPVVYPLPPLADVVSIEATRISEMGNFSIPAADWQNLYDTLQPARRDDDPAKWAILGKAEIKKKDGTAITVVLFELDEIPGAFTVGDFNQSRVYYRGGDSATLIKVLKSAHSAAQ